MYTKTLYAGWADMDFKSHLLIPVGDIERRASELADKKNSEIVVHCKIGARSQKAALTTTNGVAMKGPLQGPFVALSLRYRRSQ